MVSVRLERRSGDIDLVRPDGVVATLAQPGQPVRRITLSRRQLAECLADELRRLDPDEIYAESLTRGLSKVGARQSTSSEAIAEGEAPSIAEARSSRGGWPARSTAAAVPPWSARRRRPTRPPARRSRPPPTRGAPCQEQAPTKSGRGRPPAKAAKRPATATKATVAAREAPPPGVAAAQAAGS